MTGAVTSRVPSSHSPSSAVNREVTFCFTPAEGPLRTIPKTARDLVAEHLPRWALAALVDDVQLVTSELVTNAVQYAPYGDVGFALRRADGVLRVEVTDASPGHPLSRHADADDENGRGLELVQLLADRWGYHRNPDGTKSVWCIFHV